MDLHWFRWPVAVVLLHSKLRQDDRLLEPLNWEEKREETEDRKRWKEGIKKGRRKRERRGEEGRQEGGREGAQRFPFHK